MNGCQYSKAGHAVCGVTDTGTCCWLAPQAGLILDRLNVQCLQCSCEISQLLHRGLMTRMENRRLIYRMHAQVCSVLSNAKRLEIIDLLRSGEKTAGDLTREMEIPKPNVSQQLTILREKGILISRREGQRIYYRLSLPKMLKAYDMLRAVLLEKLENEGVLAERLRSLK